MAYQIVWTPAAKKSFNLIIDYLAKNFSVKEITAFVSETDQKIDFIQSNPEMYRQSIKNPNIHFTNILEKVLLIYRVKPQKQIVEIVHFWDGRRNPKRFKLY